MTNKSKAILNVVLNSLAAMSGVLIAAAQPQTQWQWVQLTGGLSVAIVGVLRATVNENPKGAAETDRRELLASGVIPKP